MRKIEEEIETTKAGLRLAYCLLGICMFLSCENRSVLAAALTVLLLVLLGCILPEMYRRNMGCDSIKWKVYGACTLITLAVGIPTMALCGCIWGMLWGLLWMVGVMVVGIAMRYNRLHELHVMRMVIASGIKV